MLSREDNQRLTRVGRGTPMGDTLRLYWLPALLAREVAERDGPPVRVRLLGEDLVAFRDSAGRIGLLEAFCPHRRAPLFFGRNEDCGLRCVYHGWKFDVEGKCVDQMNEPPALQFGHKVHVAAYPTVELGGVVWAYLGPPERTPAPPRFAWTQAPPSHLMVSKVIQDNNWLQSLEGGLDTSHAPILHRLLTDDTTRPGFKPSNPFVHGRAPTLEVDLTDYGYCYAGIRPLGEAPVPAEVHVRTYHFVLPCHQLRPGRSEAGSPMVDGHSWVPIDDHTTMVFNWGYSTDATPLSAEDRAERQLGNGPDFVDPRTFRSYHGRHDDYGIDRAVQRTESFTGIDGVNAQDRALQEAMGPIVDRSLEHLGPADKAIIQMRKLLLAAVATAESGGVPPGVRPTYYALVAGEGVLPRSADWRTALATGLKAESVLQTV
jgi:phenylpropionate dioxygenase-like ring-hydroxylating dioxygenase large terminal subunit